MNRLNILRFIIIISFIYIIYNLYILQIINNNKYNQLLDNRTTKIVYGSSTPRGRIYDRNGILIVDNKPKKIICYKKNNEISKKDELYLIKSISKHINIDITNINENIIKDYYIATQDISNLINKNDLMDLKNKKISSEEYNKRIKNKINNNMLININKNEAYLYYLINKGYSSEEKIIKDNNISDKEYAYISEHTNDYKGLYTKLSWERDYKFESIKSIIGKIGKITFENKNEYLDNDYSLNDIVGTSYIEKKYEKYLKGTKDKYKVTNGSYDIFEDGKKGNDIYLTIDINVQEQVSNIIKEEIINSYNDINTKYMDSSFEIISNPKTGEIITIAGQKKENIFYDYSLGNIGLSITPGSSIKAASHIVGYNNNGLRINEYRDDKCVKIKGTKEKCSIRYLGVVNDLTALKYSSNTYQFYTAMKVANYNYKYGSPFKINNNAFNLYRNTFKEFGLGVLSNIDIPNEKLGIIGKSTNSGYLLDLSIGQYDTYTPIQLSQYISTIANDGKRIRPYIVGKILDRYGNIIYTPSLYIQSTVNTDSKYMQRVKEGLKMVLEQNGTGYNYISSDYKPAGKTGTSQTFVDSNKDGKNDRQTVSTQFVGYAPYDNPIVTFTTITPNVYSYENEGNVNNITKRITRKISDYYFNYIDKR